MIRKRNGQKFFQARVNARTLINPTRHVLITRTYTTSQPRTSDLALVAILNELTNEIGAIVHGAAVDASDQNITEKVVNMFVSLEVLRTKLPSFNQRIEELLSGDDLAK